jgi:division protein 1
VQRLKKEKASMMHQLEMLGIRKNMASSEIREIDAKIENLAGMRRIILERLANLEKDEALLEHDSEATPIPPISHRIRNANSSQLWRSKAG